MNKALLVGRLTRDPEVQSTGSGIKYARFTLAIDRPFGENQTDFIPCVAWRQSAEFLGNYVKKGGLVEVEGSFTSSTYEKDGQNVTKYEVTVDRLSSLQSKPKDGQHNVGSNQGSNISTPMQNAGSQNTPLQETKTTDVPWDLDL